MNDSTHRLAPSSVSQYRDSLYSCFVRSRDALLNLNDALLTDTGAQSFVELSQSAFFGRCWSSLYSACKRGSVDAEALRQLRMEHAPIPASGKRLVLAGDASSIARPSSPTARDRTFVHQSNLPKGTKPVRPGWQFSFLVIPPEVLSSWVYTLDTERIASDKTACEVMSAQLARVTSLLALLPAAEAEGVSEHTPARPLFLGDGGYGNVAFLAQTSSIPCDCLVRLAKNRVLYRPKPARPEKPGRGRPPEDGARFSCQDAATQGVADDNWSGEDEKGKKIEVEIWNHLHFQEERSLTVSVLRVTRHGALGTKRDPKVCWFLFHGKDCPPLADIPALYARRYCIEHGFRFKKQDLMWEKTHLRTPERFALWTDMVCCAENQLFLARQEGLARCQPWESKHRAVSPQQVRRGMSTIIADLGTPARLAQTRGNSLGRSLGANIQPAQRYPIVCKTPKTVAN
jgi:hypothetical protein